MMIALKSALLFFLFTLSLTGLIFACDPVVGVMLLAVLAALAYMGIRLSRDSRRHRVIRRLLLLAGLSCALFGAAAIPFAYIESAYTRFVDWHSAGGGLRTGMTLDEARTSLAQKSVVMEFSVKEPGDFKGVRFQVEPTGTARYKFEFPLAELYYLDVAVDETGRVATVKPWND